MFAPSSFCVPTDRVAGGALSEDRIGAGKREGGPATLHVPAQFSLCVGYGEQLAGVVDVSGCVQSGPSPVLASGALIIASGPAL